MNFFMPAKLVTGENAVRRSAGALCAFGRKCLIVTGKHGAKACGALDDITAVLETGGIDYQVFAEIQENPTVSSCMAGGSIAMQFGADFVIGIGGGSALDAAKVIALAAAQPMTEEKLYSGIWEDRVLPIVLIGTTAGTGSEVTNVAVLTDSRLRKHSVHDDRLYAALALGDPSYTATLPRAVRLSTGVDALAHCLESYFSRKANDISRGFSLQGLKILINHLPKAIMGEIEPALLEAMYNASILGGLAISITGTVFPHNVGYYLTEQHNVPHGWACAALLPALLEHLEAAVPGVAAGFYAALNTDREALTALIRSALPEKKITLTEEEIKAALPRWDNNNSVKNTLGTVTASQIGEILKKEFST